MRDTRTMVPIEYKDFSRTIHENAAAQDRVIKAQLELTYRCNLHCLHCYTDPYNTKEFFPRELTLAETTRLIDEMVDLGIIWLNLTGGEIFTHPHFFEIYEYAHRRGLLLMLYTNGTLFTQGIIERLRQSPPFSIDVSVHSVDPEAFDRFTQVHGSFRTFIKGMELLKNSGLPFCFKTKAMNWNKDELPEIERFVTSFGQQFGYTTSLSPRLNGNLSSLAYRLTPSEIGDIETPHVSANNDGEACCVSDALGPAQNDRLFRCGCATNQIHINAWGALGTCTLQYERRVSLREHALKEAVDKLFRDVRALRYEGDSPCRHCAIHRFCDKKPSDANWERGHPEAPIPYDCDVAWTRAQRIFGQTLIHPLHLRVKG